MFAPISSLISVVTTFVRARPQLFAALTLLVWTLVLRVPFAHIVDDDEVFFSLVAARWQHGELPYAVSFDVKPPLLFLIYLIANLLGGGGLWSIKGVEIVCIAWCAWAQFRLVSTHGSRTAALWTAGLYPVYSLALGGVASTNILIQAPFIVMACDAALRAAKGNARQAAISGFLIACAGLIKQTAAFEAVALTSFLWIYLPEKARLKGLGAFILAAATPCLAFAAYFAAHHALAPAFADIALSAFQRLAGDVVDTPQGVRHLTLADGFIYFLPQLKPLLLLVWLTLLVVLRFNRLRDFLPRPLLVLTSLWLVAEMLGILSLHAMYAFYFISLIAPLLILAGLMLTQGFSYRDDSRRRWTILAYTVAALIVPAWFERGSLWLDPIKGRNDPAAIAATARALKALGVKPGDRILVPNRGLMIYTATGTLPNTAWFHPLHLVCDFPTGVANPLVEGLTKMPDFIVLANPDVRMTCETGQRHADIDRTLQAYERVGIYSGSWDHFIIYRRRR